MLAAADGRRTLQAAHRTLKHGVGVRVVHRAWSVHDRLGSTKASAGGQCACAWTPVRRPTGSLC